MKKKTLAMLMAMILVCSLLAGCGNSPATAEQGNAQSETSGTATNWPTKTIELVCPYSAGGGSDTMARQVAEALNKSGLLGKGTVIVTNKSGGTGMIGASFVANKPNDQYTLITNVTGDLGAWLSSDSTDMNMDYFKPVAMFCWDSYVLVVSKDSPFNSMEELIAYSKENPGEVTMAGTGIGTVDNILYLQMVNNYGLNAEYVTFDGGSEVVSGILGGHVTANWCNPSEADAQIEAGNMKALAVAGDQRVSAIPDVPTTEELGYTEVMFRQYRGILATKNMPNENIEKLAAALEEACKSEEFQTKYIDANCLVSEFKGPDEFAEVIDGMWNELKGVLGK